MENIINIEDYSLPIMGDNNMKNKVLIATLYSAEPVLLASTRLGPGRLILFIDKEPDAVQQKSLKLIQDSLGKVMDVKPVKTDSYDIVKIAEKAVEIIDMQPKEDEIYINITGGRKTKAVGLLLASYTRCNRIKKIAYNPEEDKQNSIVYLPKLSFKLTEAQKNILEKIANGTYDSINDLATKTGLSTAMVYRAIDELKDMDLVDSEHGIKLTDAGKIARL
jgi:CRISPR-associated protein Csa3